jgi:hypothetical protein
MAFATGIARLGVSPKLLDLITTLRRFRKVKQSILSLNSGAATRPMNEISLKQLYVENEKVNPGNRPSLLSGKEVQEPLLRTLNN